ncbi:MAG: hypothetical protein ACT4O1_14265, partial [Gemmatimonadota bacterium]
NIVELVSADPDRAFRGNAGYTSNAKGARNPLAPSLRARRTFADGEISGPVPFTPIVFSTSMASVRIAEDRPVFGSSGGASPEIDAVQSSARSQTITTALAGNWHEGGRARLSITAIRADDVGAQAGGFVHSESAGAHTLISRDARLVAETSLGRYRYSTGIAYTSGHNSFAAAPTSPSIMVIETLIRGGAPFQTMNIKSTEWRWNNVLTNPARSGMIGWSVGQSSDSELLVPNAEGQLIFGTPGDYDRWLIGQPAGTWVRARGRFDQRIQSTTAAVYGERAWRPASMLDVRTGLRTDYQSGDGVLISPRVTLVASWGRASVHGGIGLFRQNLVNTVLLQAKRYGADGAASQQITAGPFGDRGGISSDTTPLFSRIDAGFARPAAIVMRYGLQFRGERVTYGAEYTWTAAFSRPGSRRLPSGTGWVDLLESNRSLRRQQIHASLGYQSRAGSMVAHYEWVVSHDDADGPFSFPERKNALGAEWARSAGVAPHNLSIVAGLPTLLGIEGALVFAARSRAPLNLRTGLDRDGTGLYNDRGGRRRNDALSPAFRSLDAYAHRLFQIPLLTVGNRTPAIDVSLFAENLLGSRNYLAIGSSLASPFLGRPVAALPGRSVRWSFRLMQ